MRVKSNPLARTIYNFIDAYWKEHGHAPTMNAIIAHVGVADTTVRFYMLELQSWGAIDWTPRKVGSIRITGECPRIYT